MLSFNYIATSPKDAYSGSFYKTAFEIAKGTGVGTSLIEIDENMLNMIAKKPWAADGKNFSERIWGYKTTAINTIHDELSKGLMSGRTVDEMSKSLAKAAHVKEGRARQLVLTETAYFSSLGGKDCFNSLNVEKFEVLGTLDGTTCSKCRKFDGKVYDMKDFEVEVTAPPFHCNCRCTKIPYFDDEFTEGEKRFARDEKGNGIYVDSKMKFDEWKEKFVNSAKENNVDNSVRNGIIKIDDKQFGKKVGKHAQDFGLDASSFEDREKVRQSIFDIVNNNSEIRYGEWRGQKEDVIFYIKDSDVVITKKTGEFVTVMPGGVNNERVKNARKR